MRSTLSWRADYMRAHGLFVVRTYLAIRNAFGIEPIIYWKDRMNPLRYEILNDTRRALYGGNAGNPGAREGALALRHEMVSEVFARFRPTDVQVGKYYPYREAFAGTDCWSVIEDIKRSVDPQRLMNPGALGLD